MRKSLSASSLSFDKPYVVPPRNDTGNWAPYGLRLNYKDSEEVCIQTGIYAGPPVSGTCPGAHEQTPSYGQIVPLPCGHLVDSKG